MKEAAPRLDYLGSGRELIANLTRQENNKAPLLTAEEEVLLAKRIEAGRKAARKLKKTNSSKIKKELTEIVSDGEAAAVTFFEANLRLVPAVIRKNFLSTIDDTNVTFEDLEQEGRLGLLKAVDKFDWRMGNKFSTYAMRLVWQEIINGLNKYSSPITKPKGAVDKIRKFRRLVRERNGVEFGSIEELSKAMGVSPLVAGRTVEDSNLHTVPFEQLTTFEDGEKVEFDRVDPEAFNPATTIERESLAEKIASIIKLLTPGERKVLDLRYGLSDGVGRTFEEVGKMHGGLTKQRIEQIHADAISKLKSYPETWRIIRDYF